MLVPTVVVGELMERVFEVQRIFNAAFWLVALTTGMFVVLVVLLSQRLRQREMETLHKLGCQRRLAIWLHAAELLLVLLASLALAGVAAGGGVLAASRFTSLLTG